MNPVITERERELNRIMKKYGVKKAEIFGSFARGEEKKNSDIDILIEFERGRSLLDMSGLKIELEELLKRDVDLVTYKSIDPMVKDSILSDREVLI